MTIETLLVTILAVLPGYVGLLALRFLTAEDDVPTWETIARSLVIAVVSVPPQYYWYRLTSSRCIEVTSSDRRT